MRFQWTQSLASLTISAAAAAFTAALAPSAAASGVPDNLDGPCWALVPPNLPNFPPAQLPGLGICWKDCNVDAQKDLRVDWGFLTPVGCAQYTAPMTVTDGGTGIALLSGILHLDYTRTWVESTVPAPGQQYQVWRFVVKVDLSPVAGSTGIPPCPVPDCVNPVGPFGEAFYYGYVDYAQVCNVPGVGFEQTLVLWHGCDFFIHRPGLSDHPGTFHPEKSYAIVAPHSTVQPFVPVNQPSPGGPLVAEAMRNVNNPQGALFCTTEEKIVQGQLTPFGSGCLCDLGGFPPQVTASLFTGFGSCPDATGVPSNFASQLIGFPNLLPWPHMVSTSIGCWTNPTVYPGDECVWVNEGLFRYHDSCTGNDFFEVYYGATTDRGMAVLPTPVDNLTQTFIDIADNYSTPVAGPHTLPLMGSVMKTDHVIYTNVP